MIDTSVTNSKTKKSKGEFTALTSTAHTDREQPCTRIWSMRPSQVSGMASASIPTIGWSPKGVPPTLRRCVPDSFGKDVLTSYVRWNSTRHPPKSIVDNMLVCITIIRRFGLVKSAHSLEQDQTRERWTPRTQYPIARDRNMTNIVANTGKHGSSGMCTKPTIAGRHLQQVEGPESTSSTRPSDTFKTAPLRSSEVTKSP